MKRHGLIGLLAVSGIAAGAEAYEFRCRWVEQTGPGLNDFIVLPNNYINRSPLSEPVPIRFRLQLGVFDDANGAAPAGGLLGWAVGSLADSEPDEGTNTRTPGRLSPYTFAPAASGANGMPIADPWNFLTGIDNTLGTQTQSWPDGAPAPNPPVVRGRNEFASVYEITSLRGLRSYGITAAGNGYAANAWNIIQEDPPPGDGTPGSVLYSPAATPPIPFTCHLHFEVPDPASAMLIAIGGLSTFRRRR